MERRNHNIRFNMQNEEAKKAWEYLHSKEVEEDFKSLNAFVIIAINDYYERHLKRKADSYFETREKEDAFAERMVQMVEQKVLESSGTCRNVQMQQSMLMAGLIGTQQGKGMVYPYPIAAVPTATAQPEQSSKKEETNEPEENEFLDYSFGG